MCFSAKSVIRTRVRFPRGHKNGAGTYKTWNYKYHLCFTIALGRAFLVESQNNVDQIPKLEQYCTHSRRCWKRMILPLIGHHHTKLFALSIQFFLFISIHPLQYIWSKCTDPTWKRGRQITQYFLGRNYVEFFFVFVLLIWLCSCCWSRCYLLDSFFGFVFSWIFCCCCWVFFYYDYHRQHHHQHWCVFCFCSSPLIITIYMCYLFWRCCVMLFVCASCARNSYRFGYIRFGKFISIFMLVRTLNGTQNTYHSQTTNS